MIYFIIKIFINKVSKINKNSNLNRRWGSYQKMLEKVSEKEGKCLVDFGDFISASMQIKFQCKCGNIFENLIYPIINGIWCPRCRTNKKRLTKEDKNNQLLKAREKATTRGGKLLSTVYVTNNIKMEWECGEGHKFLSSYNKVVDYNRWCPYCNGGRNILSPSQKAKQMNKGHSIAKKNGGLFLASEYITSLTKYLWECGEGHKFSTTFNDVVDNAYWCPKCNKTVYRTEMKCREILTNLCGIKFDTKKPKWLLNSRGGRMEFDGYNKRKKIAFEYQGEQHYYYNPFFHRNGICDLYLRNSDDIHKRTLAKQHGIRLIVIPYYIKDLEEFIYNEVYKIDPSLLKISLEELRLINS